MKNRFLIWSDIGISSCPTKIPTNSTAVTVPSEKALYFNLPNQNPAPSVRKTAMAGYSLSAVTTVSMQLKHGFEEKGLEKAPSFSRKRLICIQILNRFYSDSSLPANSIRNALMNPSISPSITPPTSEVWNPVRWSLTRRSSIT